MFDQLKHHVFKLHSKDNIETVCYIFHSIFKYATSPFHKAHTLDDSEKMALEIPCKNAEAEVSLLNNVLGLMYQSVKNYETKMLEILNYILHKEDREFMRYSKVYLILVLKGINQQLDHESKKLIFEIFTKVLTLSYVQDTKDKPNFLSKELMLAWQEGH
jgi:hypothetical protein